jgi:uncharacterized membrane protein
MKTKIVAPDRVAQPTWSWPTHLVSRNMVSDIPFALPAIVAGLVLLSLYRPSSPLGSTGPRPDYRPHVEELLVVGSALGSLVGIVALLTWGNSSTRNTAAAIGLIGVFTTWAMLHLMYSTRYAQLYYAEPVGGIDFNGDDQPSYRDSSTSATTWG